LKSGRVVNEALVLLPCQLENLVIENRHAFGEVFFGNGNLFDDFAGFEFDLAQTRCAVLSSALPEHAIEEDQPLCVSAFVMRPGVFDFI
jgi:hypothetical protein